jgi:hypothetical protein
VSSTWRRGPFTLIVVPSVLAIISKAVYKHDAKIGGRVAGLGDVVPLTRYVSKNKGLSPVAAGGSLFLVTVRPPDESLWLVAILESPKHDGENWNSPPNTIPIANISGQKNKIKFANGAGISAKKGALGMSLQTPRVLADEDVALLRAASGGAAPVADAAIVPVPAGAQTGEKGHLNAHEAGGVAPCLCRKCIAAAPERFVAGGIALVRDRAAAEGRLLWYWLPESVQKNRDVIRRAVESRLRGRARPARQKHRYANLDALFAGGSEGADDELGDDE